MTDLTTPSGWPGRRWRGLVVDAGLDGTILDQLNDRALDQGWLVRGTCEGHPGGCPEPTVDFRCMGREEAARLRSLLRGAKLPHRTHTSRTATWAPTWDVQVRAAPGADPDAWWAALVAALSVGVDDAMFCPCCDQHEGRRHASWCVAHFVQA